MPKWEGWEIEKETSLEERWDWCESTEYLKWLYHELACKLQFAHSTICTLYFSLETGLFFFLRCSIKNYKLSKLS